MALANMKQMRSCVGTSSPVNRRTSVVVKALSGPSKAAIAAAAASLLLASSPAFAAPPMPVTSPVDPVAVVAEDLQGGKDLRTRLREAFKSAAPKKVQEDPFGADRASPRDPADSKRPIAIPTEQEAVAPEAFPNPSQAISPRPPVLAAAEGDENQGANAGQFSDLTETGRQALIDAKSPAESSR